MPSSPRSRISSVDSRKWLSLFLFVGLIALGIHSPASAQTTDWKNTKYAGPGSYNWNDSANWTNGIPNSTGAIANLGGPTTSAIVQIDLQSTPVTLRQLNFNDTGVGYLILTTGSAGLTFNNANAALNLLYGNTAPQEIAALVTMQSALSVTNNSSNSTTGTMTFSGGINLNANTITFGGTGNTSVTSVISGAGSVTKTGIGTLTLNQANTFTGVLQILDGTVVATGSAGALGAGTAANSVSLGGGNLRLANGSNLDFSAGVGGTANTTVTANSTITSDVLTAGAGKTFTLGTLSIGAQRLTVSGGSNVTSGTAGVTFGATTLAGASILIVNNPVGGGTTQLSLGPVTNGANTATITGNGSVIQTGVWGLGATPTGGITYNGTGTLTLNQGNFFTGVLSVAGGTVVGKTDAGALGAGTLTLLAGNLQLSNSSGSPLSFNRNTTVSGTSTITSNVDSAGTGNTYTLGTLVIGAQQLNVVRGANATGTAGVVFGNTTLSVSGTILNVGANVNLTLGTIAGNFNVFLPGTGTLTLSGTSTRAASVTYVTGGGTVVQTNTAGLGTAAATLTLSGGSIVDLATDTTTNAYPTTLLGNATIQSNTATSTAGITHTLGALTSLGANTLTISKGASATGTTATVAFGAATMNAATTFTVNTAANLTLTSTLANGGFTPTFSGAGNATVTGIISGGGGLTTNLTGTLTLTAANTYTGPTNISAGTVTLGNVASLGAATVSNVTMTGGTLNLAAVGASVLSLSGNSGSSISSTGTATLTINPVANSTSSFAGAIGGGGGTLSVTIVGAGGGAVTLSGSNNYTGTNTTLTSGKLNINNASALSASTLVLTSGIIDNTSGSAITTTNNVTLGGSFAFGGSNNLAFGTLSNAATPKTLSLMGTNASTLTFGTWANNVPTAITNIVTLPGSTSKLSIGTFVSTSTATAGTINGNSTIAITGGIQPTVAAAASIVVNNTGTITVSGTSTYTGATTLNAGSFIIDNSAGSTVFNATSAPTLGGGTLGYTGTTTGGSNQSLGNLTITAGMSTIQVVGGASGTTTLTVGTTTNTANGSMLNINLSGTGPAFSTSTTNTNGILGARGSITVSTGGTTEFATKSGSNVIQLTGQGALPASGATNTVNYAVVDSLQLTATESGNSLRISTTTSGQSLDINGKILTVTSGGILFVGSNAYEIKDVATGGSLKSATATNSDLIVHNYATAGLTISAVIANGAGASVVSLDGPGTTTLSASNTYTGATVVSGGAALSISNNNNLGAIATGAALTLNNATLQATANVSLDNAGANIRAITLGAGGGTFEVTGSNTLTVLGVISSTGSLTKTGTGTLLLSTGVNTYSGGFTNIQNGALQLGGAAGSIAAGNFAVLGSGANSGKLILGDATNSKTQTVAGLFTQGSGTANAVVGTAAGTSTLQFTGSLLTPSTFGGTLGGGGSGENNLALTVTGGSLTLTGTNTYTGNTSMSTATAVLNINSATAIGTGTLQLNFATATIDNTSASSITLTNNNNVTTTTGFIFAGTKSLNFGSGSLSSTLAATPIAVYANTLTFGGGLVNNVAAGTALTLTVSGSGTLSLNGFSMQSNTNAGAITNVISGTANVNITGAVTNGAFGNANGLSYTGTGVLTLSAANTYTGTTTVNNAGGILRFASGGSLNGGAGNLTLTAGTVDVGGQAISVGSLTATAGLVTSSSAGGSITSTAIGTANAANFSGALNVSLTMASGAAASAVSGNFTNTGDVTFTSAAATNAFTVSAANFLPIGNVTFNANNTGAFTVSAANFNPTGTVTNSGSGSGTTTISGVLGSNVTAITQSSPGSGSPLVVSGTIVVKPSGLTITQSGGGPLLTVGAGTIIGSGNVTVVDSSTASGAVTFSAIPSYTGNLTLQSTATTGTPGVITVSGALNNSGQIINNGTGNATNVISGVIGLSVTGVVQNSATSAVTIGNAANTFAGGLTILKGQVNFNIVGTNAGTGIITLGNSAGGSDNATLATSLTAIITANPIVLAANTTGTLTIQNNNVLASTFSGTITGNNNLSIVNTAGGANVMTFSGLINNVGTVTISGGSTGTTALSGGIGANVTQVTTSTTAAPTITNMVVSANGTTLTANSGAALMTVAGAVTGLGNLLLQSNSTAGITISATVSSIGSLTSSGTGPVTISGIINDNISSAVTQNGSNTLTLSGVNTFNNGLQINSGTVSGTTVAAAFGAGTITLGASAGSGSAFNATLNGGFAGTHTNPITVASGTSANTLSITSTAAAVFSGALTLNNNVTLTTTGSALTLSAGSSGSGNIILNATGAGVITLSTGTFNSSGTITNSGSNATANVISGTLGASQGQVIQNSANSSLVISGTANGSFAGGFQIIAGTLNITGATNATGTAAIQLGSAATPSTGAVLQTAVAAAIVNPAITITGNGNGGTLTIANNGATSNTSTFNGLITTSSPFTVAIGGTINTGSLTFTGGVANGSGSGNNLTISLGNSVTTGSIVFSGATSVNNAGSITATNTGAAPTSSITISAPIGSNVTSITNNMSSTGAAVFTLSGATVANTGPITFSGGGATTVTFSATNINSTSTITNQGTTTGATTISGILGSSVGLVTQNSSTSQLILSGNNASFVGGVTILKGRVQATTSGGSLGAAGSAVTLGNTTGSDDATLQFQSTQTYTAGSYLVAGANTGIATIQGSTTTGAPVVSGSITLNHDLVIAAGATGATTANLTFNGAVTGDATPRVLNINYSATALTGSVTFAGTVNHTGTITNTGNTTGSTVFSNVIGTNVTSVTQNSATSKLIVSAANTYTGSTIITLGTFQIGNGGTSGSLSTSSTITDNGTLAFNRTNTVTQGTDFNALISGAGSVAQLGTGTLLLNGANTYAGTTSISAGTISVTSIGSVNSVSSNLGAPTTIANGTISIGATTVAGTLLYTGTGETTDRVLNLAGTTGGATIDHSGTGTLRFTSDMTATGAGAKTLTLQGSTAGVGELAGAIVNGSGTTSLVKAGTGTWYLSGTNTFTGTTTVAGTLVLQGNAAFAPTSSITLGTSATLKILDDSAGTVNRSTSNLVLTNNNTTTEVIFVGNNNTANGGTSGGTTTGSTIQLGNITAFGANNNTSLNIQGANGYRLQIGNVTLGLPTTGSVSDTFNPTTAPITVGGNIIGASGKAAGAGTITVVLGGTASGNAVNGAIQDAADFPGNANAVATRLTANGTGSWTLSGTSTYTGPTAISSGTLTIGSGGSLGNTAIALSGGSLILSNASALSQNTLTLSGTGALTETVANALSGTVALSVTAGTATLDQANNFTGNTSLSGGVLNLQVGGAIASSNLTISGGTLQLRNDTNTTFTTASTTISGTTTINVDRVSTGTGNTLSIGAIAIGANTVNVTGGNGYVLGLGAATQSAAGTTIFSPSTANLTLSSFTSFAGGSSTLSVTGTGTTTITGNITQGAGNTLTLDRSAAAGTLVLQGTSTMTGPVTITNGTIQTAVATNAFGSTTGINIGATGTLALRGDSSASFSNGTTAYPVTLTASGATINVNQATTAAANQMLTLGTVAMPGAYTLNTTGANISLALGAITGSTANNKTITNAITAPAGLTIASYAESDASARTITFSGTGNTTITGGISQNGANALAVTYSGTGTLTLQGTSGYTGVTTATSGILNASTANAMNASDTTNNLAIGAAGTFQVGSSFTIAKAVVGTAGAKFDTNSFTTSITGLVSGTGYSKIGTGTLYLGSNANTNALLTVAQGTVKIDTIAALATAQPLGTGAVTLGGSGTTGVVQYTGGDVSSTKTFTLAAGGTGALQVDTGAATLTITGIISGGGSLQKDGPGSLSLGGANTYSGGTFTINNGAVLGTVATGLGPVGTTLDFAATGNTRSAQIGAATTLLALKGGDSSTTVQSSGAFALTLNNTVATTNTYSGKLSNGGGTLSLTLPATNLGTQVLNGSVASTANGAVTVNSGTLRLDFSNLGTPTNLYGSTANLTLGGGNLELQGASSQNISQTLGTLTLTAGTSSNINMTVPSGGTATLYFTGNWTPNTGTLSIAAPLSASGSAHLNVNGSAGLTVGTLLPYVTVNDGIGSGIGRVVASTGLSAQEIERFTFPTTALSATSNAAGTDFGVSGTGGAGFPNLTISLNAGTHATNSVSIDTSGSGNSGTLDLNGQTISFTSKTVTFQTDSSNTYTVSGAGQFGASATALTIFTQGSGQLIINSQIGNNAAGTTLSLTGSGTTVLGGTQVYTGATTVSSGTLILNTSSNMPATAFTIADGAVQLNSATTLTSSNSVTFGAGATGSLSLNGQSVTIGALSEATVGGAAGPFVQNGHATTASTLTVNATGTYNGILQNGGAASLALRVTAGTLTLANTVANTYTGGTTLNGGSLVASTAGAVPAGSVSITSGTLTASVLNSVLGTVTVNSGTLLISATGAINNGSGTITFAGNGTLQSGASYTLANAISLASGVTLTNSQTGGTTTFTGAVTGGSNTQINLQNNAANSAAIYSGVDFSGFTGTIQFTGTTTTSQGRNSWTGANGNTTSGATFSLGGPNSGAGTVGTGSIMTLSTTNASGFQMGALVSTGTIATNGGTINVNATGGLVVGGANSGTLGAPNNYYGTLRGTTAGTSTFTKVGTGVQQLSGDNTYLGDTTISGGTLIAGGTVTATAAVTIATANVNTATDTFTTSAANTFQDGYKLYFTAGTAPTGTTQGTAYFVINTSGNTFQLSTSPGGAAVDLTAAGTNPILSRSGAFGTNANAIILGDSATATNNSSPSLLTGGAFTIERPITVANQVTSGIYSIGGNTASSSVLSGAISLNQPVSFTQVASGTLNINGGVTSANSGTKLITFASAGDIAVSSNLTSGGGGTLAVAVTSGTTTFSGNGSNYTGSTTISGTGTLRVSNSSGSATGTGSVTVNSGGTLGGNGFIDGAVTVNLGGVLAPGASIGNLNVNNNVDFNAMSTFAIQLGTGSSADKLTLNASKMNFLSTSILQLVSGNLTTDMYQQYTDGQEASGGGYQSNGSNVSSGFTFGTYDGTSNVGGTKTGTVDIDPSGLTLAPGIGQLHIDLMVSGDNLILTVSTPEPATVGLIATAAFGIGRLIRRRRTKESKSLAI